MSISEAGLGAGGDGVAYCHRRRRWSEAQKRQIVAATHEPGVSVAMVARRYNVNATRCSSGGGGFTHPSPRPGWPAGAGCGRGGARRRGGRCGAGSAIRRRGGGGSTGKRADGDRAGGRSPCDRRSGGRPVCAGPRDRGAGAAMIPVPSGVRVWLATGVTDMRRGMNTLALQVERDLGRDPHAGDLFAFRGRRGDLVKILWHDGLGTSLYTKRLERGRFPWPTTVGSAVSISAAQLGYLLEGIEWRNPVRTWRPSRGGLSGSRGPSRSAISGNGTRIADVTTSSDDADERRAPLRHLFARLAEPDRHREAITSRPAAAARLRPLDPACRPDPADGDLPPRGPRGGGRGLAADRRLLPGPGARCGAVGRGGSLAPDPGRSDQEVPPRSRAGPATVAAAPSGRASVLKSTPKSIVQTAPRGPLATPNCRI